MRATDADIHVHFRGRFGAFDLDAAFDAPASGVTALFGASGSGKTTVLRCMAGLHRMTHGHCAVAGEIWQDEATFRPAHRRAVGYVFQEASLFPHLSVRRNLLYGAGSPATHGSPVPFDEVVDLLGVGDMLERSPEKLSGGERQRVAIGRALLSQPKILLMDEPLSALDRRTKDEILPFLERLHARLSLPVIYVSHDLAEVERLADTLVLMEAGRVLAAGPMADIQSDLSLPLAAAPDASARIEGIVREADAAYGLLRLDVAGGDMIVHGAPVPAGTRQLLRVRATDISIARERPHGSSILNVLDARILASRASGFDMNLVLGLGTAGDGAKLLARVTRRSWDDLALRDGDSVFTQVKALGAVSLGYAPNAAPMRPDVQGAAETRR